MTSDYQNQEFIKNGKHQEIFQKINTLRNKVEGIQTQIAGLRKLVKN